MTQKETGAEAPLRAEGTGSSGLGPPRAPSRRTPGVFSPKERGTAAHHPDGARTPPPPHPRHPYAPVSTEQLKCLSVLVPPPLFSVTNDLFPLLSGAEPPLFQTKVHIVSLMGLLPVRLTHTHVPRSRAKGSRGSRRTFTRGGLTCVGSKTKIYQIL